MVNLKKSKLITVVIHLFSFSVGMSITLPIVSELDGVFSSICLLIVTVYIIITVTTFLETKLNEHIVSEIQRHKSKHINDFFDHMENDSNLTRNVLRKDIPIFDENNEEIGTQTIYSAISSKRHTFLNKS